MLPKAGTKIEALFLGHYDSETGGLKHGTATTARIMRAAFGDGLDQMLCVDVFVGVLKPWLDGAKNWAWDTHAFATAQSLAVYKELMFLVLFPVTTWLMDATVPSIIMGTGARRMAACLGIDPAIKHDTAHFCCLSVRSWAVNVTGLAIQAAELGERVQHPGASLEDSDRQLGVLKRIRDISAVIDDRYQHNAFHDLDLAVESGTPEEQQTAWSDLRELVRAPVTAADVAVVAAAAAIGRRVARPL